MTDHSDRREVPMGTDATERNNGFDVWLRRSLASRYQKVLREPIPDEIAGLLRTLDEPLTRA